MNPVVSEPSPAPAGASRRAFLRTGLTAAGAVAVGAGGMYAARGPVWAWKRTLPPAVLVEVADDLAQSRAQLSYAQFGEDLVAGSLFYALKTPARTFLDIGAHDPIASNNTYAFYKAGARGVLVEPNPAYTEKLKTARPGDTVLAVGIGITDAEAADYYVIDGDQLNTFDPAQAERLKEQGRKVEKVVKMPLVNINKVIDQHLGGKAPDLLSIDIEGLDFEVLNSLDYDRFRPKVVCAETIITGTNTHNPKTRKLMEEKGYELRGMTYPNMFFVDKNLLAGK